MCGGGDKPKQTPEEKELGRIAIERWNDYQTRFRPVEDEYIRSVQKTGADFDQARGQTAAGVQMAFGSAEDTLKDNLFANGLGPDDGNFLKAIEGLSDDRALSMGTGLNETDVAVDNQHLRGLQSVVEMGQGQAGTALNGMGNVAADATRDAIDRANRSFENRQAGLHMVGNVAGAGTNYAMGLSAPGGTSTQPGTFARTTYNHEVGKGGF